MTEQLNIAELRRLHEAAGPGEAAALIPAVLHALPALLDAAEERDALKAKFAALAEYRIDHLIDCEFDHPANPQSCTCGLIDLLAAAKVHP